jgi:hypothetical protein
MAYGLQYIFNQIYDDVSKSLRLSGGSDRVDFPAASLSTIAGTPGTAATNGMFRVTFPDAATTTVGFTYFVPLWWNTFSVNYIWTSESGTGNVRWQTDVKKIDLFIDNISEAVFATNQQTVASGTAGVPTATLDSPNNVNSTGGTFGSMYGIQISRLGADAADTLAAAAGLISVYLIRKS